MKRPAKTLAPQGALLLAGGSALAHVTAEAPAPALTTPPVG